MHTRRWLARAGLTVALASLPLILVAAPAAAELDRGQGTCVGNATIDGRPYTQDQPSGEPVLMPEAPEGDERVVVEYDGRVTFDNRNHGGRFVVLVGPFPITIADWGDPNPGDDRVAERDTEDITDFYDSLPAIRGQFLVRGEHDAMGGGCAGTYLIEFPGNALDSPVTIVGIVGAGFSAILVVVSGRRRSLVV